jgi:hypothetical protein
MARFQQRRLLMEPSLNLFLAAVIFGVGFTIGQTVVNAVLGLLRRS